MINKQELIPLLNTMSKIYVSGQNAVLMGDCIRYVQQLIDRPDTQVKEDSNGEY